MSGIRILRDVTVPLRDGTRTAAEVWIPDDDRPHPAILVRTPYLKETAADRDRRCACRDGTRLRRPAAGRARPRVIRGDFEQFVHEQTDGFDSVAWVARQRWCDGQVVIGRCKRRGSDAVDGRGRSALWPARHRPDVEL